MSTPQGIRLNNPGLLRKTKDDWLGLDHAATAKEEAFFVFLTPADGIRALCRTLITYQKKHHLWTVRQIIERWAPAGENDTESYIRHVRQVCGVQPGNEIDVTDWQTAQNIVRTIIRHENGTMPYSDAQIAKGLTMAGLTAPAKPAGKSRTNKGALVAAGGTGLTALAGSDLGTTVASIGPVVSTWYAPIMDIVRGVPTWVFLAIAALGIAYVLYARWDDSRKGLR